jgi:ligand-binding sensor domain-containing protein
VQSSSFRLVSAAISILLLAALVTVIYVAIRDNPSTALPIATPTGSLVEATAASAEATLAAAPTLSAESIEAVTPTPTGEPQSTPEETATEEVSTEVSTAEEGSTEAEAATPTATATEPSEPQATAVVVPEAAAAEITPTFDPDSGPIVNIYSNSNFVNGVASLRSTLWAATGGGVVAWNKETESYVKFTTVDGLLANATVSAAVCPLPGLGILFAGPLGIQIFDTQNGGWRSLNSSNSTMRYDDVATLWCSVDDALLVVGYTRQGIDLFDASTGTWSYLGPDEGLEVNGIRDIAVIDGGATLWLATQNGLALFRDGETELFTTENSPLVDNRVEAIAADGAGAIWLTSADTLYRIDRDQWDTYEANGGNFPSGRLTGLDVGSNGAIWIGSDQTQLCRFDPGVEGCISFYRDEEGMAAAPLTSLSIDGDGEVYYTTAGAGISVFDGETWRQLLIADEPAPSNAIRHMAQAADGAYWLAGNGGASRFVLDSDTPAQIFTPGNSPLPSTNVNFILPTATGVWFGTETATFYDGVTWTTYSAEDGLTGTSVQAITADAESRIWLGTNSGLSIWTGSAFFNLTSSNGLPSEDITALQTDGSAVWIGTRGGGLLRFQDNQLQLFNRSNSNLPGDTIYALALTPGGDLLIASDQGLARYAGTDLSVYPDLEGQAIIALAAAPGGEIWVATALDELLYFNGAEWVLAPTEQLPSPQITTLFFDDEGTLWIGTAQGGLARYLP